ncbi:MAG: methyltransferase domain-containing protein [Planctomycetia bacterium]|nr:methyltransferase domain-containing protein [Planctomycetia bacterium]
MTQPVFVDTNCGVCGSWDSTELMSLQGAAYHRCTACAAIFARPVPMNLCQINEENYSRSWDVYAGKVSGSRKKHIRKLRNLSRYAKIGNLLEIGCNAGYCLAAARDMGWNVAGVDISADATAFAKETLGLDVRHATVEEAGFPEDHFDAVFTNATLEHLRHPLSALKECRRILRPGGVFFAYTVNWDSYTRRLLGAGWKYLSPVGHVHLFTPENILTLCSLAGLQHVRTWTTGVRTNANAPGTTLKTPWYWHLLKGPLSALTRLTNKGDNISFLARKPLV